MLQKKKNTLRRREREMSYRGVLLRSQCSAVDDEQLTKAYEEFRKNKTVEMASDSVEFFLQKVKTYPILYDLKHPDYKNQRKKNKVWDVIGPQFKMDGDAAKKKWKNLRDTYSKFLKNSKTSTGQSAKNIYWQWAEHMVFLKPYLAFGKTLNNIDVSNEEAMMTEEHPAAGAVPFHEIQPTGGNISEITALPNINKKEPPVDKVIKYFENKRRIKSNTNQDALEQLFLGYAKNVKKLSLRRQSIIKMKLAQIIAEQEFEQIEEDEARRTLNIQGSHQQTRSPSTTQSEIITTPTAASIPPNEILCTQVNQTRNSQESDYFHIF